MAGGDIAPPELDSARIVAFARERWREELVDLVGDLIRIPAISPAFAPDWETTGHLDQIVEHAEAWARKVAVSGTKIEILRAPGRTPCLVVDVPAVDAAVGTVVLYGHLDKQPGGDGWHGGGPWQPRFDGTRLWGRGGADDSYALPTVMTAIGALAEQSGARPRCVCVLETGEESGSPDLEHWLDVLEERLSDVETIVCLDSGAGDYDRWWLVTSLRGHCGGTLDVRVLDEGAHSGDAGGVVPSSFRVLRILLDRVEDSVTGRLHLPALTPPIEDSRAAQARATAELLGSGIWDRFAWHQDATGARVRPADPDPEQLMLNRAWRPSLAVTGVDGVPPVDAAGNVLRTHTTVKLSLRLPPTVDSAEALAELTKVLESNPPYGAAVNFTPDEVLVDGWQAPDLEPWLDEAMNTASQMCFDGAGLARIGQGGTIPLMPLLAHRFPTARLLACGVLGPGANAHGPNESLHVPYAQRITACLAITLHAIATADPQTSQTIT